MATLLAPQDSTNMAQAQWQEMAGGQWSNGVLAGQLNAYVTTTTSGLGISVASGKAMIQGFLARSDAAVALTAAAADPTNPRIDRAVLHADLSAHTLTVQLLTGTPAPSPSPPALTQTSTVWEISLYQVRVNAASTTITSLTDERPFAAPNIPNSAITSAMIASVSASVIQAGALPAGVTLGAAQVTAGTLPAGVIEPAAQIGSGALPAGVTIPAGQVTAGTLPAGVNVPGANVTGTVPLATGANGGTFATDHLTHAGADWAHTDGATTFVDLPLKFAPNGGSFRIASAFGGTGAGTFSHGYPGAPAFVGITSTQASSSQTVGVDSIGGTTVHVNMPNSWPWVGLAE